MAHGHRFMQQVGPHHWVVRCRVCPKRFGKAEFETARDCHDWWRSHEASEFHAKSVDAIPAKRERALRLAEGMPAGHLQEHAVSGPYAMTRIIEGNHPTLCVFVTGSSVIVSYPTRTLLPRKYVSTPREDGHFPPSGMRNVSEWPRRERNLP